MQENIDAAQEKYAELKKTAAEKRKAAEKYIREHPQKAMLMAAGAGMIIGLIAGCAASRKKTGD